jgi:hypothetical protein
VANNRECIERVELALGHQHNCGAFHRAIVPVHEAFRGQTLWRGDVEVFDLTGHPKAKRAYAWSHREGNDDKGERFVAGLEIPPVESAQTAVKVAIVAELKKRKE